MATASKKTRPKVLLVNRALIKNKQDKILLIKRASSDRWHADYWELPGGKLDIGQDLSISCERETLEETGLLIKINSPLVYFESYVVSTGPYKGLPYILIVNKANLVNGKISLSKEHSDSKWLSKSQALKLKSTNETKKAIIALVD